MTKLYVVFIFLVIAFTVGFFIGEGRGHYRGFKLGNKVCYDN